MVFSSLFFLFIFLPAVFLFYYLAPRKYRNFVLLFFSLLFYAWGEPVYLILMLFSICVNFVCGLALEKHKAEKKIFRLIFLGSLFTNLGLLTFFKYGDFLLRTLNQLWGTSLGPLDLPLPIGISFYTF